MRWQRRRNWFGAVILITVGVIGLAANFNLVSDEMLRQFWKLWPLIPLAIGVRVLLGRSYYWDVPRDREPDKS
jgi:hypothetical protein